MSAKLLYSIADDNTAVQKQIGCMNGLFHLFDSHHFLSSRRLSRARDPHKRIPEGQGCKHEPEAKEPAQRPAPVKNAKIVGEKHRVSTDSSRSSVSSSCNTSSFSSLDDARSVKSERVNRQSFGQNIADEVPVTPGRSGKLQPPSAHRDVRGITVRSANKEQSATLTYIDSPRPMQKSNKNTKTRFSNLQESLGILPNFRKLRTSSDTIELSRRDSPRLSYDGRESRDASKSNARLKEFPRYSLDSKRGTMIESPQVCSSELAMDSPREVGHQRRQSGVVAKLMGLEDFPDSLSCREELDATDSGEALDILRPSRTSSGSLESSLQRETIFRQAKQHDLPKKPNPGARFPMEPAPWKILDGKQSTDAPQNLARSVYGEIEKRLAKLEFKKSGKDLRALKQILEAMQKSHEKLNSSKEAGVQNSPPQTPSRNNNTEQRSNLAAVPRNMICDGPSSPNARRTTSPRNSASSIVTMKPATVKKPTNSGGRTVTKDKNVTCRETTKEAVSPRMRKKKSDPVNVSHRRLSQLTKQRRSSGTPHRDQNLITRKLQRRDSDQGSEVGSDSFSRDLSERNNSVSLQSESSISMNSWEEAEVTSAYRGHCGKKAISSRRDYEVATGKSQMTTAEQPSPISVLDAVALYGDESPSPVRRISNAFEEIRGLNSEESRWDQEEFKSTTIEIDPSNASTIMLPMSNDTGINFTNPDHGYISEILSASGLLQDQDCHSISSQLTQPSFLFNKKFFRALEQMKVAGIKLSDQLQDVPRLSCSDKIQRRLVFDIVNEILVEKFIHSHNNYILGMDKIKSSQQQLLHRLCSEIDQLQAKSSTCGSDEDGDGFSHIVEKEISNQSAVWAVGFGEISGVVLDIERLIFKDLINEEIIGGATGHILRARVRPESYCRQLF